MTVLVERKPVEPVDTPIIRIVIGSNDYKVVFVKRNYGWHVDWTSNGVLQTDNPDNGGKTSVTSSDMRIIGEALIQVANQDE